MAHLSFFRRFYLSYLGRIFAFAYLTTLRRFWGIRLSGWIKWGAIGLFLFALIRNWTGWVTVLIFLVMLWVLYIYWRAPRAGYSRFVADKTAVSPPPNSAPLRPNQHIKLHATGQFALSNREDGVLLRPSEYWKVPMGDHVVMVEQAPSHYLYQFFDRDSIEAVQLGWLIFGREPLQSLAITFCSKWGPEFTDFSQLYYVREQGDQPCSKRTIYLTFADEEEQTAVWHEILEQLNEKG